MMTGGREQLKAWIARSGLRQYQVAEKLGLTPANLCNMLSGKRKPGLRVSVRIQDKTGILPESWLVTTAQPKKRRAA
jgi:transcriptional regulator with XRE-family HTH domain